MLPIFFCQIASFSKFRHKLFFCWRFLDVVGEAEPAEQGPGAAHGADAVHPLGILGEDLAVDGPAEHGDAAHEQAASQLLVLLPS